MKGAATVGNVLSTSLGVTQYIEYDNITCVDTKKGIYRVRWPRVYTDSDGTWILVVNVRGVESGYL